MFSRHVSRQLGAHIDGELGEPGARQVERHLAQCTHCRTEREQVRFGMEILEHLPLVEAPDAIWLSIEAALPGQQSSQTFVARQSIAN
jgi:anti-sigma factor RsiW